MAVQAVRAHSDFFLKACTVGPALVGISTLQLADTFFLASFLCEVT